MNDPLHSRWLPFPVQRSRNYRVVVVTLGQSSTASDSRETFSRPATVALFPSLNGRNAEQRRHRPIGRQWSLTCRLHEFPPIPRGSRALKQPLHPEIYLSNLYDPFFSSVSSFFFPFHPIWKYRSTTIVIQPCPIPFTLVVPLPVLSPHKR